MTTEVFLPLTRGRVAVIDVDDWDLVGRDKWHLLTSPKSRTAYAARHERGNHSKLLLLHREVLPGFEIVDHKNGDGLDCRKDNLRGATPRQSAQNVPRRRDNTSGFKGVLWRKQSRRWVAVVSVDGKRRQVGAFHTREDAMRAREAAAKTFHGEFAK